MTSIPVLGRGVPALVALAIAVPARGAADAEPFRWRSDETRGSQAVSIELAPLAIASTARPYLRLVGDSTAVDVAVSALELRKGLASVTLPSLPRGTYAATLRDEGGAVLRAGSALAVRASDAPKITNIQPAISYPGDDGYSFEIIGERFAKELKHNQISVNGEHVRYEAARTKSECRHRTAETVCVAADSTSLHVRGLRLGDGQHGLDVSRPLAVTIEVDGLKSEPHPLLLSPCRRATPALVAAVVVALSAAILLWLARRAAARGAAHAGGRGAGPHPIARFLLVDPATNSYSLSKLQLLLWSGAALFAYVYLSASQSFVQWSWGLPPVPEGLPTMLGVAVGTSATTSIIADARGNKGAGPEAPELSDYITTGGVFAPERLQFLLWTLVGTFGFVFATLAQDPATVTAIPKIPDSFLPLMGVSSLGYITGKAVRKAGPIVRSYEPAPLPPSGGATVRIFGENLSPRAEVFIHGKKIAQTLVTSDGQGVEFVSMLTVSLAAVPEAAGGTPAVKVTNPDGQSAELTLAAPEPPPRGAVSAAPA